MVFVGLTDRGGGSLETGECPEEAPIARVFPSHEARSSPPVLSQSVETSVVADAIGRIRVHGILGEITQIGPAVEERRESSDDHRHGGPSGLSVGDGPCGCELFDRLGGLWGQDGLGRTGSAERDIGHGPRLRRHVSLRVGSGKSSSQVVDEVGDPPGETVGVAQVYAVSGGFEVV
jgi:hypothetical protein